MKQAEAIVLLKKYYEDSKDAQKFYAALCSKFETGVTATLNACSIVEKQLLKMSLNDSWNKGYLAFLNLWSDHLADFQHLAKKHETWDDQTRVAVLPTIHQV